MDFPTFAQTLFHLVASFAMIALGVIFTALAYYIIKFAKSFSKISENIENASDELKDNIHEIFDRIYEIPFLSLFLKPRKKETEKRSRRRSL